MKELDDLILIGGGGHCHAAIDVIEKQGKFQIKGVLDPQIEGDVMGYPILGRDDLIPDLVSKGLTNFLITVGQINNSKLRRNLFHIVKKHGGQLPVIISPSSEISRGVKLGDGTLVMHHCVINVNSILGDNNIINTGAIIEHDCKLGSHNHLSTKSIINGNVKLCDESFLGSGSTVSEQVNICSDVVIGAGSLVLKNINSSGVYVGNPIRKIK